MPAELSIILLNVLIIFLAYVIIYPRVAKADINKILLNDIIATLCAVSVAGSVFWGSDQQFNALIITLDWFWFSVSSFMLFEIPVALWYFKKHDVKWR